MPVSKQLLEILKLRSYDLILDIFNAHADRDSQPVIEDVVIVDIDEESISRLGQFSSWPSLYFADLVDSLANDDPVLIAFDVFFTESDSLNAYGRQRLTEHLKAQGFSPRTLIDHLSSDQDFARALKEAGNTYLGMFNSSVSSPVPFLPANLQAWRVPGMPATSVSNPKAPIPLLAEAAYGVGFAHIEPDISGIIHDYPLFFRYEDELYVNFSFQACLDLLGVDQMRRDSGLRLLSDGAEVMKLPLDPKGRFFLNYYGKSHRFRYISFSDVLFGRIEDGFFAGKIVLVGSSAAGLRDIKTSPLQTDYPGVELHATMMMNLLDEDFVHWLPQWLTWIISLMLLVLVALSIRYLKPLQSLSIFVLSSGLLFLVFVLLFSIHRLSLDYSVIMLPWLLGYLSLQVHESQLQYAEKKKVRNAFEHYVSKSVISQIMKVNDPLRVGGMRCQAAILFCDIRSFSTICEKLPTEAVSDFLHEHFNRCTRVVTEHCG
ncbi:MAG TPA: CHASE2 domain-containing protein, partial [Candidatus Cloacimonadota bacterium]|nr:CHASE2 domain-containing protein [Candidatus Cloacimonadota bacterium]